MKRYQTAVAVSLYQSSLLFSYGLHSSRWLIVDCNVLTLIDKVRDQAGDSIEVYHALKECIHKPYRLSFATWAPSEEMVKGLSMSHFSLRRSQQNKTRHPHCISCGPETDQLRLYRHLFDSLRGCDLEFGWKEPFTILVDNVTDLSAHTCTSIWVLLIFLGRRRGSWNRRTLELLFFSTPCTHQRRKELRLPLQSTALLCFLDKTLFGTTA